MRRMDSIPASEGTMPAGRAPRDVKRPFRGFLLSLKVLLAGYALFNRAFAYLHIPGTPVFVGEIVLAIGFIAVIRARLPLRSIVAASPPLKVLSAFVAVCAFRMAEGLSAYGLDAIRDSAIWYYSAFAFVIALAATSEPAFVRDFLQWYRRLVPWILVWSPVALLLGRVEALQTIKIPGSSTPINSFKPGDIGAQVGISLAFLWLGLASSRRTKRPALIGILPIIGVGSLLITGSQNRTGLLASILIFAVVAGYQPSRERQRILVSTLAILTLILAPLALLDVRLRLGGPREFSVRQVATNFRGMFGSASDGEVRGTVVWRQELWRDLLRDSLSARYAVSGQGFGKNIFKPYRPETLSASSAQPLRNAHNSHLTILARVGLPGFTLWLLFWITLFKHSVRSIRRCRSGPLDPTRSFSIWLLASLSALLVGAFFDPSFEGPQLGIWIWTLVGFSAANGLRRRPLSASTV